MRRCRIQNHRPTFEALEPRRVLDSTVVFNELMFHPVEDDQRGEWIEFRNLLSVDVDLSGWSISDGVRFEFPSGTSIPADGLLVVAADPDRLAELPNLVDVVGPFEGRLANDGEVVRLLNNSQRLIDQVEYGDGDLWPVAADGAGHSLSKADPYWTSREASNWRASDQLGGSLGADNFPELDLTPSETDVVRFGDSWRFEDSNRVLDESWRTAQFGDAGWSSGNAPFVAGTPDNPDALGIQFSEVSPDSVNIRRDKFYTHAIDFGSGQAARINDVAFTGVSVSDLGRTESFQWNNRSGVRTQGSSDLPPVAGELRELMNDYVVNTFNLADGQVQLTLSDLVVGTRYKTTLFTRRLDDGVRAAEFAFDVDGDGVSEDAFVVDQNDPTLFPVSASDPDALVALTYEFVAASDRLVISARQTGFNRPWAFYGLTNEVAQVSEQTEIEVGPSTHYFRTTFDYAHAENALRELRLNLLIDDGAIIYLNGTEVLRQNLPDGPISHGDAALTNVVDQTATGEIDVAVGELLIDGTNTLAVEVHQANPGNDDLRFDLAASIIERPQPPATRPRIVLNEMPGHAAAEFWIELRNIDAEAIDTSGMMLEHLESARRVELPAGTLEPNGLLLVPVGQSGFRVELDDRIVLRAADDVVLDAHVVSGDPQARLDGLGFPWRRSGQLTPGEPNVSQVYDQIVINEILYHAPPQYATPAQSFAENSEEWIELYNRSNETIDLSRWSLDGGIKYSFPSETHLDGGEYLVIASHPELLSLKYPDRRIIGGFAGSLSNDNDLLVLRDNRGNPADSVHYFDGGEWSGLADGGGASLELRDANADNRAAEAWAPSQTGAPSEWIDVQYAGSGGTFRNSNEPNEWQEFVFGLLDAGEFLIDDISVIEDPAGAAVELIQNGSFDSGDASWRLVGNHGQHGWSQVVTDPDKPGNAVLHVVATGATEHMSNHIETTLAAGARISDGQTYQISFRARWLAGSPQLHTRLYFNRLPRTTILPVPIQWGTPGQVNSTTEPNIGPTYHGMRHEPAEPQAGEGIRVSVAADDPDGIASMTLWYSVDEQPFAATSMSQASSGEYEGMIPGQPFGSLIQFYVEGTDALQGSSFSPSRGPESRALVQVDDGRTEQGRRHNLRIIMTSDDLDQMLTSTNYLTNHRLGATVIWRGAQIYYDVGARLKGSGFSRGSAATGFNLRFPPDQLLFGEHDVVSIDRQGGPWGIGASHRELTIKHIANRAGDIPMMYDDVIQLAGPLPRYDGSAQLLLARYDDVFLDSQYENGSDGTRFKYELIYYSTVTVDGDDESLKRPPGVARPGVFPVLGVDLPDLGDDPNAYRWNFLIRNQRRRDDFSAIINMTQAFSTSGSGVGGPLDLATQAAIDVDQWMRVFAFESLAGINDTYNQGLPHNLEFYVRPRDERVLALPWDMDFALHHETNSSIYGTGSRLRRVINIPTNRRVFEQHLLDIMQNSYNVDYLAPWVREIAEVAERNDAAAILNYVRDRSQFVTQRLMAQVPFEVTTNDGQPLEVDQSTVTLEGTGWIDVRDVRLDDDLANLPIQWLDSRRWQVVVPLSLPTQTIRLTAYNLQGDRVGQTQIEVATSEIDRFQDGLRVTEVHFNPGALSDAEREAGWTENDDFEFIELTNVGSVPLQMQDVQLRRDAATNEGIEFVFPDFVLQPQKSVVVAKQLQAFQLRYGDDLVPLGPYAGSLSNGGEQLTLDGPAGQLIQAFAYDDAWYASTDGGGPSLQLISPQTIAAEDWSEAGSWRASPTPGGSPGITSLPDVNNDRRLDIDDVDFVCGALHQLDSMADLDGDGIVDLADVDYLVQTLLESPLGDVDLDRVFNSSDLVRVFQAGEYEDSLQANSNWSEGDWNCDGEFSSSDLVRAFRAGEYVAEAKLRADIAAAILGDDDRYGKRRSLF